jgi:hypothetical protein
MLNTGTQMKSVVQSSSGGGSPNNPAWQAVDGLIRYKTFAYGYDAVLKPLPYPVAPAPPLPHRGGRRGANLCKFTNSSCTYLDNGGVEGSNMTSVIDWHWDGINGAVFFSR